MVYRFSSWLLTLYYRRKPKRVAITHANIRRAFPEKNEKEVIQFGKRVYHALSQTVAETILLYNKRMSIMASITNADESIQKLKQIQKNANNGMIFITAHYANWELLGLFLGKCGFPLVNVVKHDPQSLIDTRIITPFRQRYGSRMVDHKGSMIALTKALRRDEIISLMIDQVVQPPNGIPVTFFGHPTAATKAPAMLKEKYDPAIVPVFIQRVGIECFTLHVGDPIVSPESHSEDQNARLSLLTQSYYSAIESQIDQAPEQWLWLYNRWKEIKV